ncbi:hypothetical protein niasHT_034518 [Heterodera trifolii]|uniref:Uncharacterized protein n=1 Tax=Heterodera trifolii TaxID=157864 RepID=A0ABD2IYW2_9BILA
MLPATVHSGVPRTGTSAGVRQKRKTLLVLDDLVVGMSPQYLDALFTRGSHNWGIIVILVTSAPVQQRAACGAHKLTLFSVNAKPCGGVADTHHRHPSLPVKDCPLYRGLPRRMREKFWLPSGGHAPRESGRDPPSNKYI